MNLFIPFAKPDAHLVTGKYTAQEVRKRSAEGSGRIALLAMAISLATNGFGVFQPSEDATGAKKSNFPVATPSWADPFEGQMIGVAGGTFMMGSPLSEGQERSHNECQHPVSVGAFSIGKYEVTQAQWAAVMGSNPSGHKGCDDCPVENVSWEEVQSFIQKLNHLTGKAYRLPTETEWEYAARGGVKNEGNICSGSSVADEVAWYFKNSGEKTHVVGGKRPNELGLYDMSGNVWEWCQTPLNPYPCDTKTTLDPRYLVYRGGSAFHRAEYCRSAFRLNERPTYRSIGIGFRLASGSSSP